MIKYLQFIKEHKFWGKSIQEILTWIDIKSKKYWILLDTETTGLSSDPYEIQLTQISCLVVKYDFNSNTFKEIEHFNKKLNLTNNTKEIMKGKSRIEDVLKFNHYREDGVEYHDEQNTIVEFFEFLKKYENPVLVIQNAEFDMKYLNIRNPIVKFDNEVIDTKQLIQLFYLPCIQKLSETEQEYKDLVTKIGTSGRDSGLISSSMSKIGPALGINMSGYHDALTDCRIMYQMFQGIIDFLKKNKSVDIKKYQSDRIKTK